MVKFKLGIEVHLNFSLRKLFCRCKRNPLANYSEKSPEILIRFLNFDYFRGNLSNTVVDFELQKGSRHHYYSAAPDAFCLVEMGQAFPKLNTATFREGIRIASFFTHINDRVIVMRKLIADGSVSTGYQRTMLLGTRSHCTYIDLPIDAVYLEEDACGVLNTEQGKKYFLDRQGSPLLEIVSTPMEFDSIELAADKVYQLGYFLFSLLSERIPSPIRQDINISIEGIEGKVELKGVDSRTAVIKAIESEVSRQLLLLEARKELKLQNISFKQLLKVIKEGSLESLGLSEQVTNLIHDEIIEALGIGLDQVVNERCSIFFEDTKLSETRRYDLNKNKSFFIRGKNIINQMYPETDLLYIDTLDYQTSNRDIVGYPSLSFRELSRLSILGLLPWLKLFFSLGYSYDKALLFLDNYQKVFSLLEPNTDADLIEAIKSGPEVLTTVLKHYPNIPPEYILQYHNRLSEEEITYILTSPNLPLSSHSLIPFLKANLKNYFLTKERVELTKQVFEERQKNL